MYSSTSTIKQIIKAPAREVFGGVYIFNDTGSSVSSFLKPNDNLISFTIEKTAPMGKFFGFIVSQKIIVKVIGSYPLEKGRKIQPYYTIGGQTFPSITPFFFVDEVVFDEVANTTTITAYDIFQKAAEMTIDEVSITYPIDLLSYTRAVVAALGVNLLGTTGYFSPTLKEININGTESIREILAAVAEVTGTICYVYQGDYIKFRYLEEDRVLDKLESSQYFEFSSKDTVTLTQIASTTQLGENISYGEEGFTQAIWDNPFLELYEDLEEHLESLGDEILGKKMTPYNLTLRGNPFYEIGDYIEIYNIKNEESHYIFYLNDSFTYNGGYKATARWEAAKSEDIHSTPTNLSKVLTQTFSKVDKVNNEITLVAATATDAFNKADQAASQVGAATEAANQASAKAQENSAAISSLRLTTDAISASVESVQEYTENKLANYDTDIETLNQKVSATMTAEMVQLQIDETMKQGTTAVTTTTGFTFNDEGLAVSKSGSEMTTQITEDGMTVYRLEEPMLVANNEGVEAINLKASTYLIIGLNSRFEDYDNRTRTGCFWIGG